MKAIISQVKPLQEHPAADWSLELEMKEGNKKQGLNHN
mgnify:CR=1 FL=1